MARWSDFLQKGVRWPAAVSAGAALLIAAASAMALAIVQLRQDALDDAYRDIANLASVLGEQTGRSVQAIDLVLRDLQDTVSEMKLDTTDSFDRVVGGETIYRELREKRDRLPQADTFAFIDSRGRLANSSSDKPNIGLDLSDRDFFQHFRTRDERSLFVSAPVQSRATGAWTIYLARRIDSSRGDFLGVVIGGVAIRYLEEVYKSIDLPRHESFVLARRDGVILLRHPDTSQRAGQFFPPQSPWHALVAKGGGFYTSPGYFDGVERMVAVRPLRDFPLVVNAAVSKDEALATWQRQAITMGIGSFLVFAYAAFLMRVTLRQVTRLQESESHLADRSQELETILETMDQGLMMVDQHGVVVQCNMQAKRLLDLPDALMAAQPSFDAVLAYQWNTNQSGREDGSFEEFVRKRRIGDRPHTQEIKRPDGRVIETRSIPMAAGGFVRTYTDITERKAAEEKVHYLAHHDDLTRLANRIAFRERLHEAMAMARTSTRGAAVLYLDLDHFKQVNDARGHDVGDRVLADAAQRMRSAVRTIDTVARLGGDEFAIILPFLEDVATAESLARRLIAKLAEPYVIDDVPSSIGVSIGIAIYPQDGRSVDKVLHCADGALYEAKRAGRNTYRLHTGSAAARISGL